MRVELFPFQKIALKQLRVNSAEAIGSFARTNTPQVVSFTAPTGAGKTIIMAALFESILYGDELYPEQPNAIIVWLSDSPELNEQSRQKIDIQADKIRLDQCVMIEDKSFNQEVLDDGHVYFLNTQKLSKTSNLTNHYDGRQYTIWETLQNTIEEKSDRLYFVIDEAHRGMQGRKAAQATTIMQKFIKGSDEDSLSPVPVVIGITATPERFNNLVSSDTTSTIHKVIVSSDDVRSSGLLKDRIIITYPEDSSVNKDMAVFQAACEEWLDKKEHWDQYCYEQHYAYVNPIFVVQVQNNTGDGVSDTDLDECLKKFEERTGIRLKDGEVIHTFGQAASVISINGLNVKYKEPSRISEDKNIKIVFFKENLSTGWDCPRAETMMSFRHAVDATYIAQLLGRMVRTPMQMHIQVDDTLNDVNLYLPYFDSETVQKVVKEMQESEGGNMPTEIHGESFRNRKFEKLTVRPKVKKESHSSDPHRAKTLSDVIADIKKDGPSLFDAKGEPEPEVVTPVEAEVPTAATSKEEEKSNTDVMGDSEYDFSTPASQRTYDKMSDGQITSEKSSNNGEIDREGVMKAINNSGLLSYDVRRVQINDYLKSLYAFMRLLTQSGLNTSVANEIVGEIVEQINDYIISLKNDGTYEALADQVTKFELTTKIFDVFGKEVEDGLMHSFLATTDVDIERQFRIAETNLGNEGIGNKYGIKYGDPDNPNEYKTHVILFAADEESINNLHSYAKAKFHELNDEYRRKIPKLPEKYIKKYDNIVSDGDIVSKHNFRLPETIIVERDSAGKDYVDHLFAGEDGMAKIRLNGWEEGVLEEERSQADYVCWLRNPPRKTWSLCIPYKLDDVDTPTYPDFIVIRKDNPDGYIIDILEPHDSSRKDNLGKAKGFAEYARQNQEVGRIQLIRMSKDPAGRNRFKRLDMAQSAVRDKVAKATTNDELDHIFETDGFFMKG